MLGNREKKKSDVLLVMSPLGDDLTIKLPSLAPEMKIKF